MVICSLFNLSFSNSVVGITYKYKAHSINEIQNIHKIERKRERETKKMKSLIILLVAIVLASGDHYNPEEAANLFEGDIAGIVRNISQIEKKTIFQSIK